MSWRCVAGRNAAALVMAACVCSSTAYGQVLSHWRFDEGAAERVAHDSAGGLHGNLMNGAHFVPAAGIHGGALRLDHATNGFVDMGLIHGFDGSTAFSVQAWIKMDAGDTGNYLVVGKHRAGVVNGYLLATNAGAGYGRVNKCWFYTSDFAGFETNSTSIVNDGQWHQIVGVHEPGRNTRIYVDGAPAESMTTALGIGLNSMPFTVGGITFGGPLANSYQGFVDDVQIYCRALSDDDVQFMFEHPGQQAPRCPANWNHDCAVDSQDFFDFLESFFIGDADFNGFDGTDSQDLFDFLEAFFGGC